MNPHYPFVAARAPDTFANTAAPEAVFNLPFEVEHIIPVSHGGAKSEDNLALACRSCNLYKSDAVSLFDAGKQKEIRFFNPRRAVWSEHFSIEASSGEIKSLIAIGKATVSQLRINSLAQSAARTQWIKLSLFENSS